MGDVVFFDGDALALGFPLPVPEPFGTTPAVSFLRAVFFSTALRNSLTRSSKLPTMAGLRAFFLLMTDDGAASKEGHEGPGVVGGFAVSKFVRRRNRRGCVVDARMIDTRRRYATRCGTLCANILQ